MAVPETPRRIGIIGAGSSGMAAAWSLSRFPDQFHVTVIEPGSVCGGVACTLEHMGLKLNYGVQGGSPSAHSNTVELMKVFDFEVGPTKLDVSFGKGVYNWKNYETKELQTRLAAETRRFGTVLRWVARFEFLSIFVSIDFVLRMLRFSAEFRQRMVYPLVALFFGTGNQTPYVSSAVIARVFLDKSLAIFDYDPDRLLAQTPQNIVSPAILLRGQPHLRGPL
jgi:predicted NAD/FAD-binding protein